MSGLRYVEANEGDSERIAKFSGFADPGLLKHEYFSYLDGKSIFFIAIDGGDIVGTQAFVPYEMNVDGSVILSGRSERTLVAPEYRGRDVFASLMDHCIRRAGEKGHMFFWGAGTSATKAFKRSGFLHIVGHREYLVAAVDTKNAVKTLLTRECLRTLRPAEVIKTVRTHNIERTLHLAQLALSPVLMGARLPAAMFGWSARIEGLELVRQPKSDTDFDGLFVRLRSQGKLMHLKHSPAFHDWSLRGGNHEAHWFFAYRAGELVAYACVDLTDTMTAKIIDFAAAERSAFRAVIEAVRGEASKQGYAFLMLVRNRRNPQQSALYSSLIGAGFVPFLRGGNSVVRAGLYHDMNILASVETWYMTDLWGLLYRSPAINASTGTSQFRPSA